MWLEGGKLHEIGNASPVKEGEVRKDVKSACKGVRAFHSVSRALANQCGRVMKLVSVAGYRIIPASMTRIWVQLVTLSLLGSAWGQSLQQTTQWMRTFARAHSLWHVEGTQFGDSTELKFSGCSVKQILYQDGKPLNGSVDASATSYSLADLDPKSVKLYPNSASVGFETTNSEDKISISGETTCKYASCVSEWIMNFDEEANAVRFAKAMRHAITLCGGRTSPF